MKRLKAMSNREWAQKHRPENKRINDDYMGGVNGCPYNYGLDAYMCLKKGNGNESKCTACWDMPAKRNGKFIMKVVEEC